MRRQKELSSSTVNDLRVWTKFNLSALPPYDLTLTVHKPAGWSFLTPFEIFEDSTLWSAMRMTSGEKIGLKMRPLGTVRKPEILCTVYSREKLKDKERGKLKDTVAWMLSAEENIKPFYALEEYDPLVKTLVADLYGMRRTNRPDIFPTLVLAVTLQMAPITRSLQMMNLLIKQYGETVRFDGREIWYWPSPDTVARTEVGDLRERCRLGYRAQTLKGIAEAICAGFPTLEELGKMPAREAKDKLMELKGIGEYSADIVSPHPGFALDVWSAKIFNLLLFKEDAKSPREIIPKLKKTAEKRWGDWKGYVFVYVLNDLENLSKRFNLDLTKV
jgi:DNA-3-methyladenine glycosylase II